MDPIDRPAAIEHCKKRLIESAMNNIGVIDDVSYTMQDIADRRIEKWLDELPTIDAVEIIRCKNCKYYSDATDFTGKCALRGDYIITNDFCSYAVERRTDDCI